MRADREDLGVERSKAKQVLDAMCKLDGMSFTGLREALAWPDEDLQRCLAYLNSIGYVSGRVLPTMKVRYTVTELGWTASELLASLEDPAPPK